MYRFYWSNEVENEEKERRGEQSEVTIFYCRPKIYLGTLNSCVIPRNPSQTPARDTRTTQPTYGSSYVASHARMSHRSRYS